MFIIQKSVADMIMKSRDLSKLQKVKVTDKNGKTRTVYKRTGEQPSEVKQKKPAEEKPVDTKKYSDMLDKVKNGPEENALSVNGKMLNKKDAIAYLEEKTGKKTSAGTDAKESKVEYKVGDKVTDKYGQNIEILGNAGNGYYDVNVDGKKQRLHESNFKKINKDKSSTADIDKKISDLVIQQITGKISQKDFESQMEDLKKQRESIQMAESKGTESEYSNKVADMNANEEKDKTENTVSLKGKRDAADIFKKYFTEIPEDAIDIVDEKTFKINWNKAGSSGKGYSSYIGASERWYLRKKEYYEKNKDEMEKLPFKKIRNNYSSHVETFILK